jgi:hypothetical protein
LSPYLKNKKISIICQGNLLEKNFERKPYSRSLPTKRSMALAWELLHDILEKILSMILPQSSNNGQAPVRPHSPGP